MSKRKKVALWVLGIVILIGALTGILKVLFAIALLAAFWWGIHRVMDEVAKEYKKEEAHGDAHE